MRCLALFLAALPFAASAGVEEVVADHILPGHAAFADSAAVLAATADTACTGPEIETAYQDAFDAWIGVSHIQFGPIEDDGLSLAIAFWPDPKNRTGKALGQLISAEDPVVEDPAAFTEVSVAAQGLFSLERMLYDAPGDGEVCLCPDPCDCAGAGSECRRACGGLGGLCPCPHPTRKREIPECRGSPAGGLHRALFRA